MVIKIINYKCCMWCFRNVTNNHSRMEATWRQEPIIFVKNIFNIFVVRLLKHELLWCTTVLWWGIVANVRKGLHKSSLILLCILRLTNGPFSSTTCYLWEPFLMIKYVIYKTYVIWNRKLSILYGGNFKSVLTTKISFQNIY